jgi:hypothetical protein
MELVKEELVQAPEVACEQPRAFGIDDAISFGGDTIWGVSHGIANDDVIKVLTPAWFRNSYANHRLVDVVKQNLRSIALKHDGKTAVVVSTGPSLDRNIKEMLAADRDAFHVIATTSSLNPLIANGIQPDYAVINDGAHWVAQLHYTGLERWLKDVPLLIATTCHPSTATEWPGPLYWYNDWSPDVPMMAAGGALCSVWPELTGIPVGGCTTNLAVRASMFLGFNKIVLVGMDLGFSGKSAHCSKYIVEDEPSVMIDEKPSWKVRPTFEQFFLARARWLFRGCPAGCSYVVTEWGPSMPMEAERAEWANCAECGEVMTMTPTSSEYMFYLRDLINLVVAKKFTLDLGRGPEERTMQIINATGAGIAIVPKEFKRATFAEALHA